MKLALAISLTANVTLAILWLLELARARRRLAALNARRVERDAAQTKLNTICARLGIPNQENYHAN